MYIDNGFGRSYKGGIICLHQNLGFISYISDFQTVHGSLYIVFEMSRVKNCFEESDRATGK